MTHDEAVKVLLAVATVEDTYYTGTPVGYLLKAFPEVDWEAAARVADETPEGYLAMKFCSLVKEVADARAYLLTMART